MISNPVTLNAPPTPTVAVPDTVEVPSLTPTVTVRPSAPLLVPEIVSAPSSLALTISSVATALIATVGTVVSITRASAPASEFPLFRAGRAKFALLPAPSLIVPLPALKELVAAY